MVDSYRILVAIDLQNGTDRLLAEAERFAKALNAIVDVIHVSDDESAFIGFIKAPERQRIVDPRREVVAKELHADHRRMRAAGDALGAAGVNVEHIIMVQGPIFEKILEHVHKLESDLLILGSHHHGALYRYWYGDAAIDAVKRTPCAVLAIPL